MRQLLSCILNFLTAITLLPTYVVSQTVSQRLVLKISEQASFGKNWSSKNVNKRHACVLQGHNNYVSPPPLSELLLRDSLVHESHLINTCLFISVI